MARETTMRMTTSHSERIVETWPDPMRALERDERFVKRKGGESEQKAMGRNERVAG